MRDRGHAAVELALAVGFLLLPVALAVTAFGPWMERRVAAEAIAAEVSRAAVLALDHEAGIETMAASITTLGLSPDAVRLGFCDATPSLVPAGACGLERGGVVSVTVEVWTPLVGTPWGPVGGLWVVGDHSEPIDLYRSLG